MIEVELKCELFPKLLPKLQERLQHMTFDGTAHNVDGAVHLSIDHVEGLGDFLEVEMQCEEDADTSEALALLHKFIAGLDLQHIKVGYVELWLRIHNPQAYQLGKYRL